MKNVATKIALICKEMGAMSKDGENKEFGKGYKFIGYEAMEAKLRSLLAKHNLAIIPRMTDYEDKELENNNGKKYIRSIVKGTMLIIDGDTGSSVEGAFIGGDQDYGGKSMGQAITEGTKRFYFKLFHVSDKSDKDPDGKTFNGDEENEAEILRKEQEKKEAEAQKKAQSKLAESLLKIAKFKGYSKADVEKKIKGTLETAHIATIQKAVDHYAKAETKQKRILNKLAKSSGKTIIEINEMSQNLFKKDFELITLTEMEKVKEQL